MATLHAPPPSSIGHTTTTTVTQLAPTSTTAAAATTAATANMVASGARVTKTRKMVGDRWVVSKRIGQGSFATVWRGIDEKTNSPRDVAIKGISREKINVNKKHQENLDLEIDIMKKLQHPNIIQLYDVHPTRGHIYLILEYAGGGDLSHYIRAHGAMTEHVAKGFMRHLVAGLKFLRDHAIIHRDLKPQNLLLDADRADAVLKIADFGFARYIHQESLAATLCGSPLYMAPEILRYQKYDGRKADLWSVGAILFEMLTARPPWTGANHVQLLERIERTELKWPERDRVSPACSDLITKLLKRNPAERLSFEDFLLHPFVAGFDLTNTGVKESKSLTIASSAPATMIAPPQSPLPLPQASPAATVPAPSVTTAPITIPTVTHTPQSVTPTPTTTTPIPNARPIVPLVDPSTVTPSSSAPTGHIPNATIVGPSGPYTPPSYPTVDTTSGAPLAVHPAAAAAVAGGRTRTASVSSRPMMPVAALATIAAGGGSPSLQPMAHNHSLPGSPSLQPVSLGTPAITPVPLPSSHLLTGQSAEDELDAAILHIFDTKSLEWVVSPDDARYFVNLLLKTVTFSRMVEALDVWPSRLNEWLHKDMHHAIGTRIIERLNQPKAQRQQLLLQQQQRNNAAATAATRNATVATPAPSSTGGGTGGYVVTSNAIGGPRVMVSAPSTNNTNNTNNGGVMSKKSPSMSPISHAKQYGSGELPMDYVLVDEGDNSPAVPKTGGAPSSRIGASGTGIGIGASSSTGITPNDAALLYDGSVSGSEQKAMTPSVAAALSPASVSGQHHHGHAVTTPIGVPLSSSPHTPSTGTPVPSSTAPTFSSEEEALEAFYAMWKRALMVAKGAEMKEQLASSSASLSHVDFSSSAASATTNSSSAAPSSSSTSTGTATTAAAAAAATAAAQQQYGPLSVSLVLYIKALSMYHFAIASIADYRRAHAATMIAVAGTSPTASPVAMRIETFLQRCVADFQKLLKRAEGVRERMRDVQSTRGVRLSPWLETRDDITLASPTSNDTNSHHNGNSNGGNDDVVASLQTDCAEKVMHDWGLALAQEGALCEMGGDSLGAIKKYKRASLLFDQLALENEHRARAMSGLPPSLAPVPPPHHQHMIAHGAQQQQRDPRLLADAATLRRIRADIEVRVEFIDRQLRVVGV